MTDIRADQGTPLDREERLPWLEAVEEEDAAEGPSTLKLIVAVLIGLAAIGGIVGGVFWMQKRGDSSGPNAEVIRAEGGPYKVRPDKPGGMTVEGEGDTAFAASAGADPKGQINANAVPEAPVAKGQASQPQPQPAPQPQTQPAAPAPAPRPSQPAPAASASAAPAANAGPGGTVQLGAFPNGALAEAAWKAMSGRFGYLAPLSHNVVSAQVNGKTWYRLRASGPGAANICGRLRVAGENCLKID
jgi:hypothetical protein